jgi:hypothetical protein
MWATKAMFAAVAKVDTERPVAVPTRDSTDSGVDAPVTVFQTRRCQIINPTEAIATAQNTMNTEADSTPISIAIPLANEVGDKVGLGLNPVMEIRVGVVIPGSVVTSAELKPVALYSTACDVIASVMAPLLTASFN